MKGYAQVSLTTAVTALNRRDEKEKEAKALLDRAMADFARIKRNTLWGKLFHKNKTDREVCRAYLGAFDTWADILYTVTTEEEIDIIHRYVWGFNDSKYKAIKNLCQVCETGFIQLGPELAGFIDHYTPKVSE